MPKTKIDTTSGTLGANNLKGVVTRSTGSFYRVLMPDGQLLDCTMRGKLRLKGVKTTNPIAVGDRVSVLLDDSQSGFPVGVITDIEERFNYILRRATKSDALQQILCANIDQAIIVASIEAPATPPGFVDRFLVMAGAFHIPAMVVLNKIDLAQSDRGQDKVSELIAIYANCGYPVHGLNATDNQYRELVQELLIDKTSFIAGLSGAGKSSFINLADPTLHLKTGEISAHSQKGRHTTTYAEMFPLSFGGAIIDAPGLREFQITELQPTEVAHYFPEMLAHMDDCKFNNCIHITEPGCAVMAAFEAGEISERRYRSYVSMLEDIAAQKEF
jgi:ribosome biogenesis GTPase / thiamine phosphate phosphatase